jgi:para-nitrobenzyl esterase
MTHSLSNEENKGMNRRQLLGTGAALLGGALAGTALQAPQAFGQEKAAHEGSKSAAGAKGSTPPNLDPPVVEVQGGKLRGFRDGKTTIFLGIPYAEAERFELPRPVQPWEGIKSAQAWGPVSPIVDMTEPGIDEFVFPHRYWVENEHCQVLNVWTQDPSRTAKKPVMVWMHGGGFTNGSSMEAYAYDGKNLSEFGDVVVVSMNHRLNIIGTLDLSAYGPEYAQSRYTGTADLVAALQWVHDNIESFGGDPGNVTIFGQSGGGGKVQRMMHTPSAKGLFHKAVCQSGGREVMAGEDVAKNLKTQQMIAAQTLKNLNLTGDQIDKLKTVPYPDLIAAGDAALKTVAKQIGKRQLAWAVYADDKYITRDFCDWASNIPLMYGNVFSEHIGTLNKGTGKNQWTPQQVEEHLTAAFGDKKDALVAVFKEAFPRKKVQDVIYFALPDNRALVAKREAGKAPVYNYNFAYEYPVDSGITSFHTSEIAFVFHNLHEPQVRISTGDAPAGFALQDKVSRAWINFAKTGNPSQPGLEFKPYAKDDPQTMVFDTVSESRNLHYDKFDALIPGQGAVTL